MQISWCLIVLGLLALPARADTTITVDGDLSDWPEEGFYFLDPQGDTLPWRDIVEIRATDDNSSGSDGNLYLAFEFRSNFRPSVFGIDIDVYVSLDIDGDGQIGGPLDRVIEVTEGTVTDGDGNVVGSIGAMAYDHEFMEVSIPYAVLGLSHGSDVFGISATTVGVPGLDDQSPEPGTGQDGFIVYDGTQEPEPRAVLLADLVARSGARGVMLEWATGSERDNLGFQVLRRSGQHWLVLTPRPLAGLGSSPLGRNYRFFDAGGRAGDAYLLEARDGRGGRQQYGPVFAEPGLAPLPAIRPRPSFSRPRYRRSAAGRPAARDPGWRRGLKLVAEQPGLYRLPKLPGGPWLRLERDGVPVGLVESDGAHYFLAAPRPGRHCDDDVLHLLRGAAPPLSRRRVAGKCEKPLGAVPHTLRLAPANTYYIAAPGDDPFYWQMLWGTQPAVLEVTLEAMEQAPAGLNITLAGMAAEHAVAVSLNDTALGQLQWSGNRNVTLKLSTPAGAWLPGQNVIEVALVPGADNDLVFVDALELNYLRRLETGAGALSFSAHAGTCLRLDGLAAGRTLLFEVDDPQRPVLLQGAGGDEGGIVFRDDVDCGWRQHRYLAVRVDAARETAEPTPWQGRRLEQLAGAEVLVVTPPDFTAAAGRWCSFQRGQGRSCLVLTTVEIYDSLAGGRPGPEPIRRLMELALSGWRTPPGFVLLLGGATVDPNGYLPGSPPDYLPTFFVHTARGYEAASDGWYVSGNDGPPRAAIGRLAAGSPQQALAVVEKAIAAHGQLAATRLSALLLADSYNPLDPAVPDGQFLRDALNLRLRCLAGTPTAILDKSSSAAPRQELVQALERGQSLLVYLGHAYLAGWSSSPVILDNAAADGLQNTRFPLVISLSCFDGAFAGPWAESLGWHLVANPAGGAAAVLASSSLSEPGALRRLGERLLCRLAAGTEQTLGRLLQRLPADGDDKLRELLRTFNLLGDPTLPLPRLTP